MQCILHIGTEKTATTTLQEFVYQNSQRLRESGIGVSSVLGMPNNRKLCAYFQTAVDDYHVSQGLQDPLRREAHFSGMLSDLKKEVEVLKEDNGTAFLITSEHFHSRLLDMNEIHNLKKALDQIFSKITIICYFREQSELVRSLYSTAIRVGYDTPFEKFSKMANPGNDYYNYLSFFSKWSEVFGRERLSVGIFGREKFYEGDIRKDFLRRVNTNLDLEAFDFSGRASNEQLSQSQVILGRWLNRLLKTDWCGGSGRRRLLRLRDWITESNMLAVGRFRNPYARQIFEEFDGSNREFAKAFLNSELNPFRPPEVCANQRCMRAGRD